MSAFRFTHLDHCTVLITDVAKARQFYGEVLGLREMPAPKEFDFVAVWYDLGGQYLHLLLKDQPDTISPRHFCLHVTDARAAREHFRRTACRSRRRSRSRRRTGSSSATRTATGSRCCNGTGRTSRRRTGGSRPDITYLWQRVCEGFRWLLLRR